MSKIQLVNRGDLDIYLTGNPSITFFKSVYRKHTNFSMEDIIVHTITKPGTGNKYAVRLPIRTGDLLYKTDLILKGNNVYCGNGIANISTAIIDNIVFSIGSREIDKTYGHYLETWYELNQENPNNTITNIARIEDSSLYHLGQIADQAVLSAMRCNSSFSYVDVNLAKPTNIMSSGLSYPPTQFQRLSKSGGTYCTPNYTLNASYEGPDSDAFFSYESASNITKNFTQTTNQKINNASSVDLLYTDTSDGQFAHSASLVNYYSSASETIAGDIIGDCILPLNFWYCRSPSQAIPLISLSNGVDVEMYIQFARNDVAEWSNSSGTGMISYDNDVAGPNDINNVYAVNSDYIKSFMSTSSGSSYNFNFNVDITATYIYLDNMERQRFKNTSHEYLIEQLQYQRFGSTNSSGGNQSNIMDISSFHHPVKELIWTGSPFESINIDAALRTWNIADAPTYRSLNTGMKAHTSGIRYVTGDRNVLYGQGICRYASGSGTIGFGTKRTTSGPRNQAAINASGTVPYSDQIQGQQISGKYVHGLLGPSTPDVLNFCQYKIQLNGNDRIGWKSLQYFTRENTAKYHKGGCISVPDSIAVYSFALNPTNIEPSGTCNFSNIETIQIFRNQPVDSHLKAVNVYAINYNVLRFVNGQAGLSYVL